MRPPAGLLQPEGLLHAAVLAGDLRGVCVLCPAPAQQRDPVLARPGGVEVAAVVEGVARPPPLLTQHQAAPHHLLGLQPEPEASTQQQTVLGVGPPAQRSPPIARYMDSPYPVSSRDMLIWQIEEYLYPTSILGMIYHIRADAFIFFGL